MITIRPLTTTDFTLYQQMETGVENDYMLHVYDRLITPPNNYLYGLFKDKILVTVAGYTYFPGGNVMLGRLRSDLRFRKLGYPTQLLHFLVDIIKQDPDVCFIGGYTHIENWPAKKILAHLGLTFIDKYHNFPAINLGPFIVDKTLIWDEVITHSEKRAALQTLMNENIASFVYEAYYPFPFSSCLISDDKFSAMRIFQSPLTQRYLFVDDDYKGEKLLNIRYVHEDIFTTPGLFHTIAELLKHEPDRLPWFNFSKTQYSELKHKDCFRLEEGWELHGVFI
ncbi:hypothetical protein HMI01_27410 [Halolactibacillus miurensis]|uniref:N-acetyltransferase domain-containing protein n=1 Tax=Halolactibacillus miurensis TaxID=306541 RepID=A0A1I6UZ44_9BACI|nr:MULTISPECIES: hypothetical protein [Halolactibacillus]GEM05753.1 hypothetical protein HMI01_27410 [Halolactibacillus miurensis]SFT06719.1 hypothetical protein SAMN05421668_13715 [Halolactibacillus miurensis]